MKNLQKQYKNESNLQKRIQIHQYGTTKESWYDFLVKQIRFPADCRILEIGCGTGLLWKHILKEKPSIKQIVLSDFSEGMLDSSKQNLKEFDKSYDIVYKKINATDIPFEPDFF
jgi:ubiquinone/menaquinone biosynthesis C-methylase UbiE